MLNEQRTPPARQAIIHALYTVAQYPKRLRELRCWSAQLVPLHRRFFDALATPRDIENVLSEDAERRDQVSTAGLFSHLLLRGAIHVRDQRVWGATPQGEKGSYARMVFDQFVEQAIATDSVLASRADELWGNYHALMTDRHGRESTAVFRELCELVDASSRGGAYEWARRLPEGGADKPWSDVDVADQARITQLVFDALYASGRHPLYIIRAEDPKRQPKYGLRVDLPQSVYQEILRGEVERLAALAPSWIAVLPARAGDLFRSRGERGIRANRFDTL